MLVVMPWQGRVWGWSGAYRVASPRGDSVVDKTSESRMAQAVAENDRRVWSSKPIRHSTARASRVGARETVQQCSGDEQWAAL